MRHILTCVMLSIWQHLIGYSWMTYTKVYGMILNEICKNVQNMTFDVS